VIGKGFVGTLVLAAVLGFPGLAAAQGGPFGNNGQQGPAPPAGRGAVPAPGGGPSRGAPAAPGGIPRGGHFAAPGGNWQPHPNWQGAGEFNQWRAGHWWNGNYGGRYGSWWVVGPDWYWYPTVVAPVPDPYTPPGLTPGYWYWCDAYQQYYPYVGSCPTPWRATMPR